MGLRSRRKGHQFERDIANEFKKLGFKDAKRKLEYQASDCTGVDISNVGNFKIQCKRGKQYAPLSKIKEIKEDGIHLLITKKDNDAPIVCMYFDDFKKILADIAAKQKELRQLKKVAEDTGNKKLIKALRGTPCIICGKYGEAHHVKSVGAGGDDVKDNLMVLCREHHTELHKVGTVTFLEDKKNFKAKKWMLENDWWYDSFYKKWLKLGTKGIIDE